MIFRQIIPTFYGIIKNILNILLGNRKLDKNLGWDMNDFG